MKPTAKLGRATPYSLLARGSQAAADCYFFDNTTPCQRDNEAEIKYTGTGECRSVKDSSLECECHTSWGSP